MSHPFPCIPTYPHSHAVTTCIPRHGTCNTGSMNIEAEKFTEMALRHYAKRKSWPAAKTTNSLTTGTSCPHSSARSTVLSGASWRKWGSPSAVQLSLQRELGKKPTVQSKVQAQLYADGSFYTAVDHAKEAAQLKDEYVSTEHLFLVFLVPKPLQFPSNTKVPAGRKESPQGAKKPAAPSASPTRTREHFPSPSEIRLRPRGRRPRRQVDPVIGRDKEIRRVIRILSRKTKNNPVLVGSPGTGRPPSSKASPSASYAATSPNPSKAVPSTSTSVPSLPGQSSGSLRKSESRPPGTHCQRWANPPLHR